MAARKNKRKTEREKAGGRHIEKVDRQREIGDSNSFV